MSIFPYFNRSLPFEPFQMVEAGAQSNFKLTSPTTKVASANKTVIIDGRSGERSASSGASTNGGAAAVAVADSGNDFNLIAANCNTNVCFFCQKSFTNVYNCRRHIRTHSGEKPFQCNVCGKRFSRQSTLNTHEKIHTGDQLFKCDVCGRSFDVYRQLTEHMAVHRVDKPFTCKICNKSYSRATVLSQHMKIHGEPASFRCGTCGKAFSNELALKTHEPVHTLGEAAASEGVVAVVVVEEEAPKELTTMTTLKPIEPPLLLSTVHAVLERSEGAERAELDQFEAMDEDLDEDEDIEEEFVVMTQVKPAQLAPPAPAPQPTALSSDDLKRVSCELCSKQFRDESELSSHAKNHSCEKYKCDICDKRFSILSNFNVHKRIHKRDKPFRCDVCGKSFRLAKSLTVHMALHSESDSFNCEICDRSFGRSGSLKVHMKSHANTESQRQYIDMLCNDDAEEDIDDDEQQLMYEYIDDKPTYCDICGKKFVRSNGNMRTHKCNKFSSNDDIDMDDQDDHSATIDYWNCD